VAGAALPRPAPPRHGFHAWLKNTLCQIKFKLLHFNSRNGENQSRGSSDPSSLNRCGLCSSNCMPARGASGHDERPDTRPIEAHSRDVAEKITCKSGGIHTRPAASRSADLKAALRQINRQDVDFRHNNLLHHASQAPSPTSCDAGRRGIHTISSATRQRSPRESWHVILDNYRRPRESESAPMALPPRTLHLPLHADVLLVAQRRRGRLRGACEAQAETRRVPLGRLSPGRHQTLPR
jgi:hypothetical protein